MCILLMLALGDHTEGHQQTHDRRRKKSLSAHTNDIFIQERKFSTKRMSLTMDDEQAQPMSLFIATVFIYTCLAADSVPHYQLLM